jgi:hypothetical protein
MATKPKTTIGPLPYQPVLPGEVIPEQNIASEQALENMMAALERRKQKPFFDPTLLSLAAGFLTPTKTGGFGESLGYAAEKLAGGMDAERKREAENLAFESGVLGQAAAIEQMKRRDKEFARLLGDTGEERVPAGVEEIVVKGRGEKGKPIPGTQVYTPPGLPPTMGVPFMPPNPKILTSKEYYAIAAKDPKISAAEAVKTAQEMERNRYIENERGVIDRRTGLRFEVTGSDLVERELTNPKTGAVGTYKIPQNIAIRLDHNKLVGNKEAVDFYTRMVFGENMPAPAKGSGAIGQAPIPAGTAGPKSEQEKGVLKISQEKTAEEEAKINVDKEAALGANDDSARIMFQNAQILQDLAAKSPQAFGLLQTPTIAAAIGTAIDEGISIGNTRISLGGFYDAILKVSGVKQEDIANLEMAASALAELELKYTQLYLKGQGQVTEGERLIVRRIAGTPKNSPEFIIQKAKLIQMRSQYDIDVIDTFRDIKENDPNMTWSQFERSKTFRDMRNDFNKNVSGAFGLKPAVPSSKRGQSSSDTLSVDSMREALRNRGQ